MRKIYLSIFTSLLLMLGLLMLPKPMNIYASGWKQHMLPLTGLRMMIAMELSKSTGTNQYANGYDVQIAKKIAKDLGKNLWLLKPSGKV